MNELARTPGPAREGAIRAIAQSGILVIAGLLAATGEVAGARQGQRESGDSADLLAAVDVTSIVEPLLAGPPGSGVAVGLLRDDTTRTWGLAAPVGAPADGQTAGPRPFEAARFEVGSIGKTFTAFLLASAVERGEVALADPISRYLPGVSSPAGAITLLALATHTSGLPSIPTNLTGARFDPADPWANYQAEDLLAFLADWRPTDVDPGYQYSNVGSGLLGYVLAVATGRGYDELLQARLFGPLGMTETRVPLVGASTALLSGFASDGEAVAPWHSTAATAGAGGEHSTAHDMLRYLRANLDPQAAGLAALAITHEPRVTLSDGTEQGLGWAIRERSGTTIHWHNGGTYGYNAFVAFAKSARIGVVVLRNVGPDAESAIDPIGWKLVDKLLAVDRDARSNPAH